MNQYQYAFLSACRMYCQQTYVKPHEKHICSIYDAIGRGKHSVVYKGRKKKSIQYYAVKSVEKTQKPRVLQEVLQLNLANCRSVIWSCVNLRLTLSSGQDYACIGAQQHPEVLRMVSSSAVA